MGKKKRITTSAKIGYGLAWFGIVILFLLTGLGTTGMGSELLDRNFDPENLIGFIIFFGMFGALTWLIGAKLYLRSKFSWSHHGMIAVGVAALVAGVGFFAICINILIENSGHLSREIEYSITSRIRGRAPAINVFFYYIIEGLFITAVGIAIFRFELAIEKRRHRKANNSAIANDVETIEDAEEGIKLTKPQQENSLNNIKKLLK